jgi:hypothetical protein
MSNFVSIDTIISRILLDIGDEENSRYAIRAGQWALDAYRRINVHLSSFYLERKVTLDDIYSAPIPKDCVKMLAVGIYRNGEFWSFTKKPELSLMPPDAEDGIYVPDESEGVMLPVTGGKFGRSGSNMGYWVEDPEHCRFFVRNWRYSTRDGVNFDTTSEIADKVIIRYKTTGIDCGNDICVPTEAQDLVVAMAVYKFAMRNIPARLTADEKDRYERELSALQENYESLLYEPHNFWEVKDAIFSSLNSTARR